MHYQGQKSIRNNGSTPHIRGLIQIIKGHPQYDKKIQDSKMMYPFVEVCSMFQVIGYSLRFRNNSEEENDTQIS